MSNSEISHASLDREHHDITAAHYDELILAPRAVMSERLFSVANARLPRAGRLLDLGAGTGQMTMRFGDRFDHVTVVDHSAGMLSQAKINVTNCRLLRATQCEFVTADAFEYLERDVGFFDAITCVGFLHHLERAALSHLLSKCAERLADNGRMVIAEPVSTTTPTPRAIAFWNRPTEAKFRRYVELAPTPDEAPVPRQTLLHAIQDAGLRVSYERSAWEIFTRYEGNWIDRIAIAVMDRIWGRSGYVWTAILKKT